MCKVSVLVPVYNVKRYLPQCLDSLAAQTLKSIEFICIDDGSTDGCSKILDCYAAQDDRFRVIHKDNSGYGASMNVGLRSARGEYIGIVESDDFADARMFEQLLQAAEEQRADVVKSNYFTFTDRDGDQFCEMLASLPYYTLCSAKEYRGLLQTDTFLWTSLYRKSFLMQNDIWFHETPGASYQDVSFSLKVALCCKRMYLLPDGFLHYRVDNLGASWRKVSTKYLCYHDEMAEYWRFLGTRNKSEQEIGTAAAYNAWRIYWTNCWSAAASRDKTGYLRRIISEFQNLQAHGRLKKAEWPRQAWEKLQDLLQHPSVHVFACVKASQQARLLKAGFLQGLRQAGNIYLYGAGQIARGTLAVLDQEKIHPVGMLVSQAKDNPPEVDGVPVYEMSSAQMDREHDIIILAVAPGNSEVQQEIYFALDRAGYHNVLVLTDELRQALAG